MSPNFSNRTKTMLCVATAGLLFIPALIFDLWYLILIGAFFDWLPLPTGWMKFNTELKPNKKIVFLHAATTLVAYAFSVLWIIFPLHIYKFLFLEIWWSAVIIGIFITKQ